METLSNNSEYTGNLSSNNLQIQLLGHCIICFKKVSLNQKRNETSSPEIAPKSVVTAPGFLKTFSQVWAVLQLKRKETSAKGSSDDTEISFNVFQSDCVSTNVTFSSAPTICRYCCDKVLMVENLIKAVRQQVREIRMLWEEGRRRENGGLANFEKNLRENGLEENVIKATLQFVGIGVSSRFPDDGCKEDQQGDEISAEAVIVSKEEGSDEENSLFQTDSLIDGNKNDSEDQMGLLEDEDLDGDPDYIIPELEGDDDNEREDEMDVEEEDPDIKVGQDPLALLPNNPISGKCKPFGKRKSTNEHGSRSSDKDINKELTNSSTVPCSCGKTFESTGKRSRHMRKYKDIHPEYKVYSSLNGNRQTCDLCGEWVMYNDILEHLRDVHLNGQDEWVIRCPNEKCRYLSVSSKELNSHLNYGKNKECKVIWRERFGPVCEICGFKGANMFKIWNHVRDKHENGQEKKWQCPISGCGKRFFIKQSVQFHLYEHRYRPKGKQNCDKCGNRLKVEEMEGHLKDMHGIEEVIGCKQCGFKFSGREEMVEHLYEHRDVGISCDICGEGKFARYSTFREHYFAVHKLCPKKYKCGEEGVCEMWFWRKETKEEHELRMHRENNLGVRYKQSLVGERGKGKKEFECEVCNVKFLTEDSLRSHQIKFHGADPFRCDICGETFDNKPKFSRHTREHAGIVFQKEWNCEVEGCGKTFKDKKMWKRHREVGHGGVKRHVCETCGKSYYDAGTLRNHHDIVHLGLRRWVCEECGEKFSSTTVLKKHKLIHTGERPFGCEICGQRFRHKGVLKTHLKGHEGKGAGFKPNGPMKQIRKRKAQ